MTTVKQTKIHGFDIESTGLEKETERIITASLLSDDYSTNWFINPQHPINPKASEVHGITDDMVQKDGQSAPEAIEEIVTALTDILQKGEILCGYNIIYDLSILEYEARRYGIKPLSERMNGNVAPIVDPYILDKTLNKFRGGKHTLERLAELFNVELNAHDAESDARVSIEIFKLLVEQASSQGHNLDVDPMILHNWFITWKRRQDMTYADYLRTREYNRIENPYVPSGWPIEDKALGRNEENFASWD